MLPPLERRALVLIDPSYESTEEGENLVAGLGAALRRFPSGVFAIWYPLTERARADALHAHLGTLPLPPTLVAELAVAGEQSGLKMRGCGLVVLNPPWQFADEIAPLLPVMAELLQQAPGAAGRIEWLVLER
jgi:23S rRNA (adenine2030-N6)-methyltransferase